MRITSFLFVLLLMGTAFAQPQSSVRTGPYLGVQPGLRDTAPNTQLREQNDAGNALTWLGFDMSAPGGRVFIQTASPAAYQVLPTEETEVLIELKDCVLNWKNDGHHLDTSWFPSAVKRVHAKPSGKNKVLVRITLKRNGTYDLRQEGAYLFVDFVRSE